MKSIHCFGFSFNLASSGSIASRSIPYGWKKKSDEYNIYEGIRKTNLKNFNNLCFLPFRHFTNLTFFPRVLAIIMLNSLRPASIRQDPC
ncbi:hypothetical protein BCR33DRAFT_721380 [Rhizoclosmatium globosum]|uniref:Uncharacterized protein n=1 Tax=Rhizoclosmatium globosum TaxID=329046 RepID=A0A1Y2BSC2_9FUNG|nr:hypothetical protein BCR33DRAFT_721380 [Rhizoclosmatium globosum]|eukprot:ORY37651.1 hypothetical protein BCR33DRAFT_721380 [Rhizoclosmatium globosum]